MGVSINKIVKKSEQGKIKKQGKKVKLVAILGKLFGNFEKDE